MAAGPMSAVVLRGDALDVLRTLPDGAAPGDTVLDPFGGSGTVGAVAVKWQRGALLIDLNPDYCEMARRRIAEAEAHGNLFGAA